MCLLVRNKCVHASLNNTICKTSATLISECTINVQCKVFKNILPSLSFNKMSYSHVHVVNVTTTPSYQYTNPASIYAAVCTSVLSTSNVSIYPTPAVVTFNSYLLLHVYDVPVSANLLCQAREMSAPAPFS